MSESEFKAQSAVKERWAVRAERSADTSVRRAGEKGWTMRRSSRSWPRRPLGALATIQSGGTPDRKNRAYWVSGEIPWVTTAEVHYSLITDTREKITPAGLANSSAKIFPKDTILMALYGQGKTRGQVGLLGIDASTNQACAAIQPKSDLNVGFLYEYLKASYAAIRRLSNSGGQQNLSSALISEIQIPIPPLPEQRKIAEILRTWDEAIEAATKLVTALNTRREALRTKLVIEAGIGGRPTVFGEFLTESRVLGSDGSSARKITVKLYGKGAVPKSDKREGSAKTRYYRRSPGQLIYSKLDFLNGAFALIPGALQGYESSLDLPAFDISEHVNPQWLIEYLTRPAYYTAQLYLARGQRKARRIAPADFLASSVKLPQRGRQDEIAEVLAVADREIALRETELDTLTRQKRGLMQKLLTGEWRVNAADFCHPDLRGRK